MACPWGTPSGHDGVSAMQPSAVDVVARQFLFTTADIVVKVIHSVVITKVALNLGKAEGYGPTLAEAGLESAD